MPATAHAAHPDRLRILVTGASGLIGTRLVGFLDARGHRVERLVRREPKVGAHEIAWDPAKGRIDASALEAADAVIHLAGASIGAGRWTQARKREILESRVRSTRLLAETLAQAENRPGVLVCASAIGYYGDRGDESLTEASAPGNGFLAGVCRAWEEAAEPARKAGIRVVHVRTGIVLSATGGALARMLPPFKLGLGGPIGTGRQGMSWITLDDVVRVYHHLLLAHGEWGPVNAVAPNPVTNSEFVRTLGRVLRRPAILPLPRAAVKLMFGEMGEELLLYGQRVYPARLAETRFEFGEPDLEPALRQVLQRPE